MGGAAWGAKYNFSGKSQTSFSRRAKCPSWRPLDCARQTAQTTTYWIETTYRDHMPRRELTMSEVENLVNRLEILHEISVRRGVAGSLLKLLADYWQIDTG